MGKRILLPLAAALLLTGCSSMQHIENGSSINETQPTTTAPAQTTAPPPATTAAPVTTMSPEQAVTQCSPQELLALAQSDRLKEIKYKMQSLYMKLFTQEAAENVIRERVFPLLEGGPK